MMFEFKDIKDRAMLDFDELTNTLEVHQGPEEALYKAVKSFFEAGVTSGVRYTSEAIYNKMEALQKENPFQVS